MNNKGLLIVLALLVLLDAFLDWQQLKDELREMRDEEEKQRENDNIRATGNDEGEIL